MSWPSNLIYAVTHPWIKIMKACFFFCKEAQASIGRGLLRAPSQPGSVELRQALVQTSLIANAAFWIAAVALHQGAPRLLVLTLASLLSLYALARRRSGSPWRALIISTLAVSLLAHLYQAIAFLSFGALGAYLLALAYGGIALALTALMATSLLILLAPGKA